MIKFFRKIRKNMLSERKTVKYLKYAIGEIVLVVIGILIALQINNWNEHRKQNETLHGIYQIIKEDIATDIVEIDDFVDDYEKTRKPAFEAVLNGNLTKEDLQKHPEYLSVLDGFKDFAINQRGFELLKNQSNDMRIGNQNLTSKINLFYNKYLIEINIAAIEIMREFVYNLNEHKKSAWFSSFLLHKETKGVIDFMMNNPLEKNRITSYYMAYKIYVQEIQEFKKNGEEIIKQIDAIN
ncbi:DUF6090 family protein [uncultured Flavobacterium sp.]|uniref:DUF6090 family protein n=1 Tax=uncultured Flavobacterium sp. TaxID=165435 RepID=UPI0030EC1915|tara:strand:+ start:363 stop:1079 length:717 start_codon:yes stop_codon:yes gene_type:complete